MIPVFFSRHASCLAAFVGLGISLASGQITIYSDDFGGDTSDIDLTAPDISPGDETWTASPAFNADGSVDPESRGSMTLPFTPSDGFIYTLEASFSGVAGDTDWLALGFANGESFGDTLNDRFPNANVRGTTWMLFRGDNPDPVATNGNKIHRGLGAADPVNWLALDNQNGGDIDMRIVLDTMGGTGAWTATWYAKLPADESYALVGDTTTVPHAASDYTSVGISISNTSSTEGTLGTIESFSLTASEDGASIPKITGIEIDGSGNVILSLDGPADGLTAQQSNDLSDFSDIPSTASGNTLTVDTGDLDPNVDGKDFYRVRN